MTLLHSHSLCHFGTRAPGSRTLFRWQSCTQEDPPSSWTLPSAIRAGCSRAPPIPAGQTPANALLPRFHQTTCLFHHLDLTTLAEGDPLSDKKLRKCFERLDTTTYSKVRVLEVCISNAPGIEGEHPDIYARYALAILQRLTALQELILRIQYCPSPTKAPGVRYFLQALAAMKPKFQIGLAYNPHCQSTELHPAGPSQPSLSEVLTALGAIPFTFMHLELEKAICEDAFIAQLPVALSSLTLRSIRAPEGCRPGHGTASPNP